MLLKRGIPDPEKLKELIQSAETLGITRHEGEADEDYAERSVKIVKLSAEVPKLFSNGSWDTGSVIDAVTLGLASIVASNYTGSDAKSIDQIVMSLLASRIRLYRSMDNQDPLPTWSDDDVRNLIKKFQLVDRPVDGDDSDKLQYARRILKALRMIEGALAVSEVTDFDVIEALCIELAVVFGKSPLPISIIEDLVARIPENSKLLKKDQDDEKDI